MKRQCANLVTTPCGKSYSSPYFQSRPCGNVGKQYFVVPHLPEALWWKKKKPRIQPAGPPSFQSHRIPTDAKQSVELQLLREQLCCAPPFIYRPALTQPDLRARLQHTPAHRCLNALLSAGRFPQTHPFPTSV